jgi:hypothetical protein
MTQLVERNRQTLAVCRSADPDLFFRYPPAVSPWGRWPRRRGSALRRSARRSLY